MLERLRRCKYCNRDMTDDVSPLSYRENPFCVICLPERIKKAAEAAKMSQKKAKK